jgi:AraC-like DNA-binding protein
VRRNKSIAANAEVFKMRYRTFSPSRRLAQYIECFWTLESREKTSLASPERILPDGCVELIFNRADLFKRYHFDGAIEIQPRTIIAGQMQHHALIEPTGRVKLFGVRFHPGGAHRFLRLPLSELTNRIISFDDVWPRFGRELAEKIDATGSIRERISTIEKAFIARLDQRLDDDKLIDAVVKMIVARDGLVSIDRLQQNLGISDRHLERKFKTAVGISPKFFCRILRFQNVFRAVERHQNLGWSFIASECGYYDQAHFIRDFKEFSGQNPSAFFNEDHKMSEHFTRKNRLSDFYNTNE